MRPSVRLKSSPPLGLLVQSTNQSTVRSNTRGQTPNVASYQLCCGPSSTGVTGITRSQLSVRRILIASYLKVPRLQGWGWASVTVSLPAPRLMLLLVDTLGRVSIEAKGQTSDREAAILRSSPHRCAVSPIPTPMPWSCVTTTFTITGLDHQGKGSQRKRGPNSS